MLLPSKRAVIVAVWNTPTRLPGAWIRATATCEPETLIDSDWLPTIVPDSEPGRIQVPAPPESVIWNLALNSLPPTRDGEQ